MYSASLSRKSSPSCSIAGLNVSTYMERAKFPTNNSLPRLYILSYIRLLHFNAECRVKRYGPNLVAQTKALAGDSVCNRALVFPDEKSLSSSYTANGRYPWLTSLHLKTVPERMSQLCYTSPCISSMSTSHLSISSASFPRERSVLSLKHRIGISINPSHQFHLFISFFKLQLPITCPSFSIILLSNTT